MGIIQREIQESAYRYQKAVESKEQIIVGVNDFTIEETLDMDMLTVDPKLEKARRQKMAEFRAGRDQKIPTRR